MARDIRVQGVEALRRCLGEGPTDSAGLQITWKLVPFRIQPDLEDGTLMTVETSSKVPKVSAAKGLRVGCRAQLGAFQLFWFLHDGSEVLIIVLAMT